MVNAIADRNQLAFIRIRDMWQPEYCDPMLNAYARLYIARGLEAFSTRVKAIEAFRDAAAFAEQAQVNKAQFEALQDLERLERDHRVRVRPAFRPAQPLPEVLQPITQALSEIYVLAETQANAQ
jgi:hypothetical protein